MIMVNKKKKNEKNLHKTISYFTLRCRTIMVGMLTVFLSSVLFYFIFNNGEKVCATH